MANNDNSDDFKLIRAARDGQQVYASDWEAYEDVYRNVLNHTKRDASAKYGRAYTQTPIVYDTLQIKLSIFSSSFQSSPFPVMVDGFGEVGQEVARQLRLVGTQMWKRSSPFVQLNKAMLRMLVFNVGILLTYWDVQKKKVVVKEINPKDVCFDPEASDAGDVQYYTYDRYMAKKDVLRLATPKAKNKKSKVKKPWFNQIKNIEDVFEDYDKDNFDSYERMKLVELYTLNDDGSWHCKTFVDETQTLVHEQTFNTSPFSWGYAIDSLSSVKDTDREEELHMYGGSEAKNLKPYAEEMIDRKNQFVDIVEEQINPSIYVATGAGANAAHLKKGAGTRIPCEDPSKIVERRAPTATGVLESMSMAKADVEDTSAINGFYKAQTSASDRRSTGAIALLEAKASTRIEMQILTAKETLYDHFVQNYMALVYKHAPKSMMRMLDIDPVLVGAGVLSKSPIKEVVTVEFGADMDKDRRYASYMEAAQVLGQFGNADPAYAQNLVMEALKLKVGDRIAVTDDIFESVSTQKSEGPEGITQEPIVSDAQAQPVGIPYEEGVAGGI